MPNHIELLDLLLKNRGISTEDKEKFLNPSYDRDIYDPFKMLDMERACVRIFEATEANEKIIIYSDYDCDGIPASVIMHDFFNKIGYKNFSIYIPDRHDEGYGLHSGAVDQFVKDEAKLLITFDLGITAVEETAKAQAYGIDVIITDHHLPQEEVPRAYAILNPKQSGCNYPDKMLCGSGVAYKLIQGLIKKYGEYWKINNGWEKWLLDMVGVATLSDQVPLIDENRIFAFYGLKVLQKGHRLGLVETFRNSGVDISKLNEEDVTFTLAPRINAASRMGDPMNAFELLSTTDSLKARELSDHLVKINNERKITVAHIMKDIKKTVSKRFSNEESKPLIVIGNPDWRVGVLGIVASKVVEEYKMSAFVWGSDGNGAIKGSCRSFGNINLVELMSLLPSDSLSGFGGHAKAGGFSVSYDKVHLLEDNLIQLINKDLNIKNEENDLSIDCEISIDDVNSDNYKVIEQLAPYGVGNPKPVFLLKNLKIYDIKEFGKEKNHLEITFLNSSSRKIKSISFFKTRDSFNFPLIVGGSIDLTASIEKSSFAGRTELRLRIVDISITI